MRLQHHLLPSVLSFIAGLGVASAHAEMATYTCQFDPTEPAGLTINYDTESGQFALVNFYGSAMLPDGAQVTSFNAMDEYLDFSIEFYQDSVRRKREQYNFDMDVLSADLERHTYDANGEHQEARYLSAECSVASVTPQDNAGAFTPPAGGAAQTTQITMPYFYGDRFADEVLAAVQQSELSPAIGTPAVDMPSPQNAFCAGAERGGDDPYIEVSWCASAQMSSDDLPYGEVIGLAMPDAEYGGKPSWCTGMGGYGNFGQGASVELKYWLPADPAGIRSLVIRSGTGIPGDSPFKHSKPRVLRVEAPGMTWTWNLESTLDFQAITFDQPIHSEWVRVVIEDAYLGEGYSNTCISDLFSLFEDK